MNPQIADMLVALEQAFVRFGIDFYLVGAVARDIWMSGIHHKMPQRTTGDIDFAVLINDKGVYEQLKKYLIENAGFSPSHDNAFVLIWKDKTQVDLLPFGIIEDENRRVKVDGTGFTSMELPGFREIYEEGLPQVELEGRHRFKLCTLPGIVLLKLIAWHDRPEVRRNDILDISNILQHFFEMYDEQIWTNHHDLFDDETANLQVIAARVMGREMKRIARRNQKLYQRMFQILEANTTSAQNSPMAEIMTGYFKNTVMDNLQLIEQIKLGFTE